MLPLHAFICGVKDIMVYTCSVAMFCVNKSYLDCIHEMQISH